jgi:hypothetical protein
MSQQCGGHPPIPIVFSVPGANFIGDRLGTPKPPRRTAGSRAFGERNGTAISVTPRVTGTKLAALTPMARYWFGRTAMSRGAAAQSRRIRSKSCAGRWIACSAGCPQWRTQGEAFKAAWQNIVPPPRRRSRTRRAHRGRALCRRLEERPGIRRCYGPAHR